MKPVSIVWVLAVGLVAAGLSFLGFFAHMREGGTPMIVTPGPAVIFAIATACLIWSGLAVRRLRAGKETWIDAIGAMRVAVFARASAIEERDSSRLDSKTGTQRGFSLPLGL